MYKIDLFYNPILKNTCVKWIENDKKFICFLSDLKIENIRDLPQQIYLHNIETKKFITFSKFSKKMKTNKEMISWVYKSITGASFIVKLELLNNLNKK